jgi:hypothetical protein
MAIAEHHPSKLYARNRGLLRMGKKQLHEFASTKEKHLPARKKGLNKHQGRYRPREKRKKRKKGRG